MANPEALTSLHVKNFIDPSNVQKFLAAGKNVFDQVAKEEKNAFVSLYQLAGEPGTIKLVESWNLTMESFMNEQAVKDYYKPYLAETEPLYIKPREIEVWRRFPNNEWLYVDKDFDASTYTGPSLSLHVKITIAPENVGEFLKALKPAYDAVIAEKECVFFEVYESAQQPGVFAFVEDWNQSAEWLVANQLPKEYYKPYLAATEPMFVKPREHEIYQHLDGDKWLSQYKNL